MDKKTFSIGILSITALILFLAQFIPLHGSVASAADSIRDRDYQIVTARVAQGGEALYVVDNRTGLMAVFTWDPTSRALQLRAVRPVVDAFNQ